VFEESLSCLVSEELGLVVCVVCMVYMVCMVWVIMMCHHQVKRMTFDSPVGSIDMTLPEPHFSANQESAQSHVQMMPSPRTHTTNPIHSFV